MPFNNCLNISQEDRIANWALGNYIPMPSEESIFKTQKNPLPFCGRGFFRNNTGYYLTRSTYEFVRVSIFIFSPSLTNKGTLTTAPVSKVAGLSVFVAVSPLTPGSA